MYLTGLPPPPKIKNKKKTILMIIKLKLVLNQLMK